ncbi:MAG: site-specific DNA-methyltransferase, partial [Nitrososphaeraceae archaeon]
PSPFPTILPEMCIKLRGNVKLAVDPFGGIGPSAVASMNLNKSFIRFEIDNFYLDITAKRLETLS